tara:strand:- start:256 stop:537 length:282 start_codon:yes stop_codon:yes gene_type:complete
MKLFISKIRKIANRLNQKINTREPNRKRQHNALKRGQTSAKNQNNINTTLGSENVPKPAHEFHKQRPQGGMIAPQTMPKQIVNCALEPTPCND